MPGELIGVERGLKTEGYGNRCCIVHPARSSPAALDFFCCSNPGARKDSCHAPIGQAAKNIVV